MNARLLIAGSALLALFMVSCNDSPTGGGDVRPTFAEFVRFDASQYAMAKLFAWPEEPGSEPFLPREQSFGEPFTDVNGNGVYDLGIDIFVKSVGPDNQDINYNGKYDGPEAVW